MFSMNMYSKQIHPLPPPQSTPSAFLALWTFFFFFPRQRSSLFSRDRVSVVTRDSLAATLSDTGGAYGEWGYLGMVFVNIY